MQQGRQLGALIAGAAVVLTAAAPALAHDDGGATRLPTARERAIFEAQRSPAAKAADAARAPARVGAFGRPFTEPTLAGRRTSQNCIDRPNGDRLCKPMAGTLNVLSNGRVFYWNALEGQENIKTSIATQYGAVALNEQSRLLNLRGPTWRKPTPVDGGANPNGYETDPLVPGGDPEKDNDGGLFCSDQAALPDGRILATGGTAYYRDPAIPGTDQGVTELEGLRNSRIYDPRTNRWTQTGSTHIGRWYPSMVELGSGRLFVASGVQKLVKPLYPDRIQGSGSNVKQTETYNPRTGRWTDNGRSGQRSLPLFPRLSLLPNGHVFYNAAGQAFNPFGQSYDMEMWNVAASYDPARKRWKSLGVPGLNTIHPGFRGSSFSVMLPLRPDAHGRYTRASFLAAGGEWALPAPNPGSYIVSRDSSITTVDTRGGKERMSTRKTGPLNQPRWYSTGVLLPTGDAMAFSGADRDEVQTPGVVFPVKQAELFDHTTGTWKPMASGRRIRTYHNTAALLPDGRVLVGGHAPLTTLYTRNQDVPGFAPNQRDPSFEIYKPPYLFCGARPKIRRAKRHVRYRRRATIKVNVRARRVKSVVLVRNATITHLVDGEQRNVVLPVVGRKGRRLTVKTPPSGNVAPPGPYMLFVNIRGRKCGKLVPSRAKQVFVGPRR